MSKTLGYIGMGVMGFPMASNLLKKSGCPVIGFDVFEQARQRFIDAGGQAVDNTDEIIDKCEIIFLCLPSNELVKSNVEAILEKGKAGTIIVDMGSTAPGIIRELSPKAAEKGITLIDSPVSGGETGAIAGTLVIMCGGDKAKFDEVEPLLHCMGSTVTYMGQSGCGSVAKLANNMIVGCNLIAVSEAFAFAKKAGLDPQVLFDAIKGGFAQNAVMDIKVPKIISRDFTPSARIAVHYKDIKNAMQLADEMGVEIPASKLVYDCMHQMDEWGEINLDQCALVHVFEKAMDVEVK